MIPGTDADGVYRLRMDDFVPPDRRMDAFPSRKYEVPPLYQSDAVSLTCALDTAVTVQIEDHTLYLEAEDLLLLAPFSRHRAHMMNPEGGLYNVVLRPARLAEALPRLFAFANPVGDFLSRCTAPDGPLFLHLPTHDAAFDQALFAEAAMACIQPPGPDAVAMLLWENRLERCLLMLMNDPRLLSQRPELSSQRASRLSQILGYVQHHLPDVTLQSAAAALGWNASHLSRTISQQTGRSFTDIVQVLRLDEACTLLRRTDCTVEEAMSRVGYAGKANFYAQFRRRFGQTPAQYRRGGQGEDE